MYCIVWAVFGKTLVVSDTQKPLQEVVKGLVSKLECAVA